MRSEYFDDYEEDDSHRYIGDPDSPPQDKIARSSFPRGFDEFMQMTDEVRKTDPDLLMMRNSTTNREEASAIEIVKKYKFKYPDGVTDLEELVRAKDQLEGILREMESLGLGNTLNFKKLARWYFLLCNEVIFKGSRN